MSWLPSLSLLLTSLGQIKADEDVVFFPTYGHAARDGTWQLHLRGWIFEPEESSLKRREVVRVLAHHLKVPSDALTSDLFKRRMRPFLVDNERSKTVRICLEGQCYALPASDKAGHFQGRIGVPAEMVRPALTAGGGRAGWLSYRAVTRPGDSRTFPGMVHLLGARGLSVVSDIDDTIKITEVRDRQALLANTFLREFRAVPGMAELYRGWSERGASFHYVSASPWQLYRPLEDLRQAEGFPAGTYHLKAFRLSREGVEALKAPPEAHKRQAIGPLFEAFPGRRFVLVGDSGEMDPEIYGRLAREHPGRVVRIFIRDVTGEPASAERYRRAFEGLPAGSWAVFREPSEVPALPAELFE